MTLAYLVPLGTFDKTLLASVAGCLQQTFGVMTRLLNSPGEPRYALDMSRQQYNSTTILMELERSYPAKGAKILGVAEQDLCIPTLSFVFGQAQLGGSVAVVSLARLRQEFYGLPPNASLLQARVRKESIHEMGHTFGLTHCPEPSCPMSLSTSVRHVDAKSDRFCNTCVVLLRENLQRNAWRSGNPLELEAGQ